MIIGSNNRRSRSCNHLRLSLLVLLWRGYCCRVLLLCCWWSNWSRLNMKYCFLDVWCFSIPINRLHERWYLLLFTTNAVQQQWHILSLYSLLVAVAALSSRSTTGSCCCCWAINLLLFLLYTAVMCIELSRSMSLLDKTRTLEVFLSRLFSCHHRCAVLSRVRSPEIEVIRISVIR